MITVLFWDIDGTLLTTGRAGIFAWEEGVAQVLRQQVDLDDFHTSGLTDLEIARELSKRYGSGTEDQAVDIMRIYEFALPNCLPRRQGKVLDGVVEVLSRLRQERDVLQVLLTGNTRVGAGAKLQHYGLAGFFAIGSFGDESADRTGVALRARDLARDILGAEFDGERAYVIGDTPADVACGKAAGIRTVAVASGTYSSDELREHKPWAVLESLPEPAEFLGLLKIGRAGEGA